MALSTEAQTLSHVYHATVGLVNLPVARSPGRPDGLERP